MSTLEIISAAATFAGAFSLCVVFTVICVSSANASDKEALSQTLAAEEVFSNGRSCGKKAAVIKNALFALLLIAVFCAAFSGEIFGKTWLAVASGSMSEKNPANAYLEDPDIQSGFARYDIIMLDGVDSASDLKQYDVIAYRSDDGKNVIHRIIRVVGAGENARFVTRGDANAADDDYAPFFKDVIGVYHGTRLAWAGALVLFLRSYSGMMTVAAVIYCLFVAQFFCRPSRFAASPLKQKARYAAKAVR